MLEVKNVNFIDSEKRILNNINFNIKKNKKTLLLGENGSGKSILIDCIMGNVKYKGDISINTNDISVLYDFFISFSFLKVSEILSFFDNIFNIKRNHFLEELFQLQKINNVFYKKLSKGERKKIGLYMSLSRDSEFLIMDEPTDSLDPLVRENFWNILRNMNKTCLISNHIYNEALDIFDNVMFIYKGEIICPPSSVQEIYSKIPYEGKIILDNYPKKIFNNYRYTFENNNLFKVYFKNNIEKNDIINILRTKGINNYSIVKKDLYDFYNLHDV